jgi:hypothetical protein
VISTMYYPAHVYDSYVSSNCSLGKNINLVFKVLISFVD